MADLDLYIVDDEEIHNMLVNYVEENIDEKLYPGDERKIFMEAQTSFMVGFLVRLNEYFNQRFAQYAKGRILDAHGENEDCYRLQATKAVTTERFSITNAMEFNIVIPEGTRVTADNEKYFATDEAAVITAGNTYVDIPISAVDGGSSYNGFAAGQVNKLVDLVEYISSVENLTETTGGDDGEPYPEVDGGVGDEHYYERIRLAKSSKSTAGARSLYEYYAKSADASIENVEVQSPAPGRINLAVSCKNGTVPSQAVLDAVLATCSAETVRPLGDNVTVSAITQVTYDIELTYYTTESEESDVIQAVEGENGAIARYNLWQSEEIGRAINPDRLRAEILKSEEQPVGAEFVTIVKPEFRLLSAGQVAKWSGNMTVTHSTSYPEE